MKIECPRCHRKSEFALSGKDMLFTTQYCDSCELSYTRVLRNVTIKDGKICGEVTEIDEEKQKGGKGHGKEEK